MTPAIAAPRLQLESAGELPAATGGYPVARRSRGQSAERSSQPSSVDDVLDVISMIRLNYDRVVAAHGHLCDRR